MIQDMFLGAYGDDVIIGALFEMLEDVTPDKLSQKIRNNDSTLNSLDEEDWVNIRQLASKVNMDKLTPENIIVLLAKRRPDLLYVLWKEPNGHDWAENLYEMFKQKLEEREEIIPHRWVRVIQGNEPLVPNQDGEVIV